MDSFASLCTGIGGFDLGFERAGMRCVFQCEQEPNCNVILERHWPDVPRTKDVNDDETAEQLVRLRPDWLCFGFPCQDLSVAGRRAGLAGERSGLFFRCMDLTDISGATGLVIENVPGLLSSNDGQDFVTVLDRLEESGFVVDVDILDSQFFGLAQRRRRVFFVCQKAAHLLQSRTSFSAQIIAQCLIECLGSILVEARLRSENGEENSTWLSGYSVDGLRRRMKLFGMRTASNFETLQSNLDAEAARFPHGPGSLDSLLGGSVGDISLTDLDTWFASTSNAMDERFAGWSMLPSWRSILKGLCVLERSFTTSTATNEITEEQIYFCAKAYLTTLAFTALSNSSCHSYWNLESCALTVGRAFTCYARQATSDLFTPSHWVRLWRDFLREAFRLRESIGSLGDGRCSEILFESEGLLWDSAPRRETGTRVAGTAAACLNSGGNSGGFRSEPGEHLVAGTIQANYATKWGLDNQHVDAGCPNFVTHALTAEGHDASEDGTGRGVPPVAAFKESQSGCRVGSVHATLDSNKGARRQEGVILRSGIRRLTEVECERLQGFPDNWTAGLSGIARYRALGNAVSVPVAEWIGRRIVNAG